MREPLTSGRISRHLLRLTAPSVVGFLAIIAFNLTDTYFVSALGTKPLAAMGFTFPIVMVVGAIAVGISTGAGSILARSLGAGNRSEVKIAATHGILLALAVTAVVGSLGLATMNPLFRALGADGETLDLVKQYMVVWYAGCIVVVTPPVGDSNLRSSGDMFRPAIVMVICAAGNIILDPLLIYGRGPFPAMGIAGAAWATVISRLFGMAATLTFNYRSDLLILSGKAFKDVWKTWGRILAIGIPAAITQLLPSLLRAVLTAIAAISVGTVGVAAIAAGSRVESVPLMIAFAFNFAILTLVAQNFGAGRLDRVNRVRKSLLAVSLGYGVLMAIIMWFTAPRFAAIFSSEAEVILLSVTYVRVAFIASPGILLLTWNSIALNAVGRPLRSLALNSVSTLLLMIPGALAGRLILSDQPFLGMMLGLGVAYVLAGFLAWFMGRGVLDHKAEP